MKIAITLCVLGCLLVSTPVPAQVLRPSEEAGRVSGIMASAYRAADSMELQPNAAPQRQRRRGRLFSGLTMVGIGAGLIVASLLTLEANPGRYVTETTYDGYTYQSFIPNEAATNFAAGMFFGGIASAAIGGVLIARADDESRIRIQGERPKRGLATKKGGRTLTEGTVAKVASK